MPFLVTSTIRKRAFPAIIFGETDERIHQDRKTRRPDGCHDIADLAGQIKVGKIELRIRALEYYDPQVIAQNERQVIRQN